MIAKTETEERIQKLSERWFFDCPFFNEFILRMSFKESKKFRTVGISPNRDKRSLSLIYNNQFMQSLTDEEFEGVMLHEILHIIALTHPRGKNKIPYIWNAATDYANNYEIQRTTIQGRRVCLPEQALLIEDLTDGYGNGYNGKIVAEEIYEFLKNILNISEETDISEEIKLQLEKNFDNHDNIEEIEADPILQEVVKSILDNAKTRSYGNVSRNMVEHIENLTRPKIGFIKDLIYFINNCKYTGSRFKISSYSKLNRRNIDYLPGKSNNSFQINIGVDTSGSIGEKEIKQFFTEIDNLASNFDINLIQFDCEIQSVSKYKRGNWRSIEVTGRGGTDIQPFLDEVSKNKKPKVNIIFTDGYFDWAVDWHGMQNSTIFVLSTGVKPVQGVRAVYLSA
jgi:predicted metal-dependent peptidase